MSISSSPKTTLVSSILTFLKHVSITEKREIDNPREVNAFFLKKCWSTNSCYLIVTSSRHHRLKFRFVRWIGFSMVMGPYSGQRIELGGHWKMIIAVPERKTVVIFSLGREVWNRQHQPTSSLIDSIIKHIFCCGWKAGRLPSIKWKIDKNMLFIYSRHELTSYFYFLS